MPDEILDAYDRDGGEVQQVRASVSIFKGRKYFAIRAWFFDEKLGDYRASKNGINLPVEEYAAFRKLIDTLDSVAQTSAEAADVDK